MIRRSSHRRRAYAAWLHAWREKRRRHQIDLYSLAEEAEIVAALRQDGVR